MYGLYKNANIPLWFSYVSCLLLCLDSLLFTACLDSLLFTACLDSLLFTACLDSLLFTALFRYFVVYCFV